MPGTYQDALRPTLPGAYTRYAARRPVLAPPAAAVTVAVPISTNWGPVDVPTLEGSFREYQDDFNTTDTEGSRAVYDAFRGEGLPGLGGAGGVLVLRHQGTGALKAGVTLNNAAGTPAPALHVDALYVGTKGNDLRMVVGPIVSGVQEVSVFDGTTELESWTYPIATAPAMATLAATINATSKLARVPATGGVLVEGATGLTAGTFPLIGGNDGAVWTASDYATIMGLLANEEFAFFAPTGLPWASGAVEPAPTNRSIIASIVAWTQAQCDLGHRFTTVIGGIVDEPIVDAVARAAATANENVITTGGPGVDDAAWGARGTSQLVPRVAGIYAQRGEGQAAHFARLAGTLPRAKPAGGGAVTLADAETLTNAGVVAIMRDRYVDAPTRLVKSVNTYIANTTDKPRSVYGNPKFVLSMQQFANDAEAEIERELIGKVNVSQASRDAAAARVLRLARKREGTAFNAGTLVEAIPGSDTDEFLEVAVTLTFGRALAQLFIRGNVQ